MTRRLPCFFLILFFFTSPPDSKSQLQSLTCEDLHTGLFYAYPKNMAGTHLYKRDSEFQTEIDLQKGDSLVWKIKWINKCTYSLKYVSGYTNKASLDFAEKHLILVKVKTITDNYYTYTAYIDDLLNDPVLSDTLWITAKTNFVNNKVFEMISRLPSKKHFNDTASYALLYVYRPKKITNSLGNYLVYIDDYLSCVAMNNTGYIFKIFKQGPLEVKSILYKDAAAVKLDIKFGRTYYVKSIINWTISNRLYNFKLDMKAMNTDDGAGEFAEVKQQ